MAQCPAPKYAPGPTHPTIGPSSSYSISASSQPVPPIIVQTSLRLPFDTDNVDVFFHTFEARYFGKNLTDEQLYYELLQYLNSRQVSRVFSELKTISLHSYALLRAALIKILVCQCIKNFRSCGMLLLWVIAPLHNS